VKALTQDGQFALLGNGTRLHYASSGRPGDALVLMVHGFPQAWFEWEEQLQDFGSDHFAVAPDLRGFNLSSKPSGVDHYRARHIVTDLQLLIAHLGYQRATIVGHDWGGAIAWNLAIYYPDLVERLIIINAPHPYLFMRDLARNSEQQKASSYMNGLRAAGSEKALAKDDFRLLEGFFSNAGGRPGAWYTSEVRSRYHHMWSQPGENGSHPLEGSVNYYRASPLHPPEAGARASKPLTAKPTDWVVRVPVRVIWGKADRALRASLLDGLDALCPDLKIACIEEGSHWVVQEMPMRVNALMHAFLGG